MSASAAKILIVDDEADFCETCSRLLRRFGFDCATAADSAAAFGLIESYGPQLVVTDLNLPIGNGFDIARRAHACEPSIPVIIITAYHTAETARRAQTEGDGYLPKPFSNAELVNAINRVLSFNRGSRPQP